MQKPWPLGWVQPPPVFVDRVLLKHSLSRSVAASALQCGIRVEQLWQRPHGPRSLNAFLSPDHHLSWRGWKRSMCSRTYGQRPQTSRQGVWTFWCLEPASVLQSLEQITWPLLSLTYIALILGGICLICPPSLLQRCYEKGCGKIPLFALLIFVLFSLLSKEAFPVRVNPCQQPESNLKRDLSQKHPVKLPPGFLTLRNSQTQVFQYASN